MEHRLTSKPLQSSYIFRVHLWLFRAEITIQSSHTWPELKIAEKGLNEEKGKKYPNLF